MKFKDVEKKVKGILEDKPLTRDNDDLLYLYYITQGRNMNDVSIVDFFTDRGKYAPPFETVRRTRAKLQRDHEELRGTKARERYEKEQEVLEYVRSK